MSLLGKGVLAIWNGITEPGEAEFVRWHIREHIPERVGLPGFLRGRRYVARDGHPKYFNFYETDTAKVLESATYQNRLNAPTPWTQRVVKEFRDTSRTICEVISSLGHGEGAWIEAIQFSRTSGNDSFQKSLAGDYLKEIGKHDGIVGVHLLRGLEAPQLAATAESKLRSQPDARCEWILLIEAAELEFIQALRLNVVSDRLLHERARSGGTVRGIYRLQYGLTHTELS